MTRKTNIITSILCLIAINAASAQPLAPVSGFAKSFVLSEPIPNATITILETGQQITTNNEGHFGPILYPVGKTITLELQKSGYKTIQSGTFIVPPHGLTSAHDNISFQVPSTSSYHLLKLMVGADLDDRYCHVVTTVTAHNKLLSDCPQGEEGARLSLTPATNQTAFYFGEFNAGPLACKTNPLARHLTQTSADGGAGYFNLPPRAEPYTLTAVKKGVTFSSVQFICRPGAFINISPPRGPTVL